MSEIHNAKEVNIDLSIVIPAYNEEKRIGKYLQSIKAHYKKSKLRTEIIVIDDGSKDKTASIARKNGVKVFTNNPNRGKGYSVKRGMGLAKGKVLLFADADGATPINEADKFLNLINSGYDVVIASRSIKGAKLKKKQPFHRMFIGKTFRLLTMSITGLEFYDTQCGFKMFSRKAAKKIFPKQTIDRWGFDPEILFLAKKYKFKIKETPVSWHDMAGSKVNPIKDGIKMLGELVKVRWNSIVGKY